MLDAPEGEGEEGQGADKKEEGIQDCWPDNSDVVRSNHRDARADVVAFKQLLASINRQLHHVSCDGDVEAQEDNVRNDQVSGFEGDGPPRTPFPRLVVGDIISDAVDKSQSYF